MSGWARRSDWREGGDGMMEDQIISSRHQGSPSPHQQVSDEFIIPRDRTQIASTATNPRFVTIIT